MNTQIDREGNLVPASDVKEMVFRLRQLANELMDLDKHYQRKEHALFSCLEGRDHWTVQGHVVQR